MILSEKKHWKWFATLTAVILALTVYIGRSIFAEPGVFWHRFELVLIVYIFLAMHCFLNIKEMYNWIYKYRVLIAIGLFVFAVANCFTLSSVSMYNDYIQPNSTTQYSSPIFGIARAIRSDEWLVNISRIVAGSYNNYGAVNDIVRGTTASGISATGGLFFDYSSFRAPSLWGYYLFGAEYGSSFYYAYEMIFGALLSFELCMIITKQNKLYSVLGCAIIWFSSFNMWWSISSLLFSWIAVIVFFYYMVKAGEWKHRLLFGTLLAIAGADFCTNLYPAWQVPLGWTALALMLWILITNQEWKKYKLADWLVIVLDIVFMASVILRFIQVDADYLQAVTATVYPGRRISYGGFSLDKLLGYAAESIMPIIEVGNASESGTYFAVFPLGIIAAAYVLKKENWKNSLIWCLSIPTIIFFVYCTISLPAFAAKLFLLTNSTASRTADVLGLCCALLTVSSLAEMDRCGRMKLSWGIAAAVFCGVIAVYANFGMFSYKTIAVVAVIEVIVGVGITLFISQGKEEIRKTAVITTALLLTLNAVLVHPITVGFDAIYQKPLYKEVRSIIESSSEKTLWIGTENIINANYLIACGAPTLNSTNYVPNKDLWAVLDPNDENEATWNRYAHINFVLSDLAESKVTLQQADVINVELSEKDFVSLGIDYILANSAIPSSYQNILEQIYKEDGSIIYKVKK